MLFDDVRASLISEASRSPNLLSDLAGLEHYLAESYDARSFIELLQNADDAGASRFFVGRKGDYLCVANDGRPFSRDDFESLCRSAASNKTRASSIGYRGIGFKSVVSFAERIYVISGALEAVFCRTRTRQAVPAAKRVPLVRIPHAPTGEDRKALENAGDLLQNGYKTVFIFADLVGRAIETEFGVFDPTSLLFLRNVRQVTLQTRVHTVITLRRETLDDAISIVELSDASGTSRWKLQESNDIMLAFGLKNDEPCKLDGRQAVLHAFLPTQEKTGLGIKINGDFSTDPSRTRVLLDERTGALVKQVVGRVLDLVESALAAGSASPLLEAVVPETDARMAAFQRPSFERELLTALIEGARGRVDKYRLRPSWFKCAEDFERVAASCGLPSVSHRLESCAGLLTFLKAIGCREATLDELSGALPNDAMSAPGAADVVEHLCTLNDLGQVPHHGIIRSWRIWPVSGEVGTLAQATASGSRLDDGFLDLIRERSGSLSGVQRLLSAIGGSIAANLIPQSSQSGSRQVPTAPPTSEITGISLRKWRSGEQQVCELLTARGWRVHDVSNQNLGYDLEASKLVEGTIYVEVKSIDHLGQSFILTSNEEAVARQKGSAYRLAIVRQTNKCVEIAFIVDPVRNLQMVRQVRQWVWFCEQYPFEPDRFAFEE
jgi:hypothetical protein